jgi:hypothetical protein
MRCAGAGAAVVMREQKHCETEKGLNTDKHERILPIKSPVGMPDALHNTRVPSFKTGVGVAGPGRMKDDWRFKQQELMRTQSDR